MTCDSVRFRLDRLSGLSVWLDAANPNGNGTVLANDAKVPTWADLSFRHVAAEQPSGSAQPVNLVDAQNGRPGLIFDGAASYMSIPYDPIFGDINQTGLTVFAVAMTKSVSNDAQRLISIQDGSGDGWGFGLNNQNQLFTTYGVFDYVSETLDWDVEVPTLVAVTFAMVGADYVVTFYRNNVASTPIPFSMGANPTTGNLLIGGATPSFELWYGFLLEAAVYGRALNASEINSVSKYLATKWGITI
jgi:hypothetical protein